MDRPNLATSASTRSDRDSHRAEPLQPASEGVLTKDSRRVAVASSFTPDLVREPLQFWLEQLEIDGEIVIAPYGQIMQQLLDPGSTLAQNKGFNVLLIRLGDWIRDRLEEHADLNIAHLRRVAGEFANAFSVFRGRTSAQILVFFAPSSSALPLAYRHAIDEIQSQLTARLSASAHVQCCTHADLVRLYSVGDFEDARADRIGHIPYTSEYFVALATLLARRMAMLLKPRHKVIAIDCDNTLWGGVCGEDGATGVELTPAHLDFQRLLVELHDAGFLLCLCSKNNPEDVDLVFDSRPEMPLRQEHLVCSRVNWNSKSSNLQSLAKELDLALDSFMLVDDSPAECAEVRMHCPQVLTLQFPQTQAGIAYFKDHVWAFDHFGPTEEARRRTVQYRENRARSRALEEVGDLSQFLASLELKIQISEMQPGQLPRVAELIQRTNQFNLSGMRRRASEIEALRDLQEIQVLVVHVQDRFGDYGLVGALFLQRRPYGIEVDTFVLSCRVLGRGVEQHIVAELGRIAREEARANVVLRYKRTARNTPAWNFLETSFARFWVPANECLHGAAEGMFIVPYHDAEDLQTSLVVPCATSEEVESSSRARLDLSTQWHERAYRLSRLEDIVRAVHLSAPKRQRRGEYGAHRTPMEASVAGICAEVLRLDEVGVSDDFFELGGDSLSAVQAISRIGSVLGLELPLHEFFDAPTVEEVAVRLANASRSGAAIRVVNRSQPIPLSWSQQRLWFIDMLEGGSSAYHIPQMIRLTGELEPATLQNALDSLLARQEALRTVFVATDGEPVQIVAPIASFVLRREDLSAIDPETREGAIRDRCLEELAQTFDLSTGPLIRGRLLRLGDHQHVLLLTMHHMVSDGWSLGVLIKELAMLYGAYRQRLSDPLPPLKIQYCDYAHWQRQYLTKTALGAQVQFWSEQLQGAPALLELPTDRPRPPTQSYRGGTVQVSLEPDLVADVKALARRFNLTMAMALYSAWSIVMCRLSGQDDIVIGMPVANRPRTELEDLIGFFVNTLAVRVRLHDDPEVAALLQRVKSIMLGAYAHQDVPFEQVVEAVQPQRCLSHNAIFQVMLVLHTASRGVIQIPGLTLTEQDAPLQTSQFDLLLALQESADEISGSLIYATDLFDETTIRRWVGMFKAALREMVRTPEKKISGLRLLDADERHLVVTAYNATQVAYPQDKLIHELIEEQVKRTPDAVAVEFEGQELSYVELNERANQLARYLLSRGVTPDRLVGICVERSLEMVVGLVGIVKAGAAYVPLDPSYPADRLEYMLRDAAPPVLLTQDRLRARLPQSEAEVVALDSDWSAIAAYDSGNLDRRAVGLRTNHLAYVIYTSGSTGQPKGAMNEHRAVTNRLLWMQDRYQLHAEDRVLQKTPFSFDVSVWEFFWTLITGARLVVAKPQGHQDPEYLRNLIEQQGVTTLHFVPSMLQIFLDQNKPGWCATLRRIICSGEELPVALQNRCLTYLPQAALSNLYGPTEAAIDVTSWECRFDDKSSRVPIGRPIANVQMYVLDRHGEPTPVGVAGEIYIGGVGVGRGYLNRPELTAQRFVADTFGTDSTARLYKTGDLGRWRPDGAIEYLGRNDFQVKIRGLRVELGEIEAQLLLHVQVKETVVVAYGDVAAERRLVAYVVPEKSDAASMPSADALRAHLKASLPEHMVPSGFVMLDRMPLSPNGKLDRRALPAPDQSAYASQHYEAPQGETEEALAGIWQQLLPVERVGRHDNFFSLGGHSLLIMRMLQQLRRVGLSAQLRQVFEAQTLADLASVLTSAAPNQFRAPPSLIPAGCQAITPQMLPMVELAQEHIDVIARWIPGGAANIKDIYPLAPLQEGILFHHLLNEHGGDTYVLSTVLSVESRQRVEQLTEALQRVVARHDVLRTAVLWEQLPRPVQVVQRQAIVPMTEVQLEPERDAMEQIKEWIKPERQWMDLRCAPLLRLTVAADPGSPQWFCLFQLHHTVCDHVTAEIVIAETVAHLNGRAGQLPDSVPYREHVAQVLAHDRAHDAEAFFRSKLGYIDEPTVPFGLLDVHGDGSRIEEARRPLDHELAARTRVQARRLGVSAATLFHAAWSLIVARTSGRDEIVFGSVLLGRLQGGAGTQRMLGMFINTLPLRLQLEGVTAKELVEQTQRELVALLNHEQASLSVAQRCSGVFGATPLFSALLNYRHSVPDPEAEWSSASGIRMLLAQERTNYPLTVSIDDLGAGFFLTAKADRRIEPQRVLGYVQTALGSLVEALERVPQSLALTLSILPLHEQQQVIEGFNATEAAFPSDKLVPEIFEEQVARTPNAVAVLAEGRSLTFAELNGKANQLARYLRSRGVGPDQPVGLCVERSLEMVVGLLGIMKAGGAYVPLDPSYPSERLQHILADAARNLVLVQESVKKKLRDLSGQSVALDGDWHEIARFSESNLDLRENGLRSHHLAYVIYTSGSTGLPKGVMIEHRNLLSLWQGLEQVYRRFPCERIAVNASFNFDASVKQFVQLLSGRTIVLVPQEHRWDAAMLMSFLQEHRIEGIDCTPWQLKSWISAGLFASPRQCPLRVVLVGGEAIDASVWNDLSQQEATEFYNVYGPTESTVDTTFARLRDDATAPHIGRPMENRRVYILDRHRQPVPIGVVGEMYIGGAGVARGYLNKPALTQERFLPDPFCADPLARMYKTGDLCRWRTDGCVEYVGRNDHQVKIRGHRIELGEIEALLVAQANVGAAVVIAREDVPGDRRLVAYVTLCDGSTSTDTLRAQLRATLPDYMVPVAFVVLNAIPLTANGKVDRASLPAPESDAYARRQYDAPQGEVEEVLAGIWQGLLGVERVGRQDNFFELGGHSLLIVQMKERLRRVGLVAEVRRVFESPTLTDLAGALTRDAIGASVVPPNLIPSGCEEITPAMLPLISLTQEHIDRIGRAVPSGMANIQDIYPLAPLQEGILFHHLLGEQRGDIYVVPFVLSIASRQRLHELIAALQAVVDRHDILRTSVLWEQLPQPVQVVLRRATLPVTELALDERRSVHEQLEAWLNPEQLRMDLRKSPLLDVHIAAPTHQEQCYAMLRFHHIAVDGVSMKTVISEVVDLLQQQGKVLPSSLAYREHVAHALAYSNSGAADAFFRGKLADIDEPTAPFHLLEVHGDDSQVDEHMEELDAILAQRARTQARRLNVSAATLFHAAWGLVVARTSRRDEVVYGTVLLGRLQGSAGAKRVVGMFINTLPLRLRLHAVSVREFIEQTQRELIELLAHEQASLADAQRCSGIAGSTPLFGTLLNYRHASGGSNSDWSSASGIQVLMRRNRTSYPITVSIDDFGDGFTMTAQTDRRVDPRRMTHYLQTAMHSLVEMLEQAPHTPILALSILPPNEQRYLIETLNATRAPYPREKLIHQLFEEQVERTPDAVAVMYEQQSLTYSQLNSQANQLARYLRNQLVGADQVIGICLERSPEMIVGLLGILKAGGAYVPLDPNYPPERLQYMLEDAAPGVVLTQVKLKPIFASTQARVIALDEPLSDIAPQPDDNLDAGAVGLSARNLVYVIYTSGSTGRPKGTSMSHAAMVNLMEWQRRELPGSSGQRVLQFAALSFDVAFQEIFTTLSIGSTLVLLDEWVRRDARALLKLLSDASIERLFVPPLMLQSLAEAFRSSDVRLSRLRDVITAGEQLRISREIVEFFTRLDGCRLHNHYGPTETHVVTALTLAESPSRWPVLPTIGRPIENTQIYVLNELLRPTPLGVPGEIYIAGANVARGYRGQPKLTEERFVQDPFSDDPHARMYKTGDLGRWCSDGTIEYLGRNDDQVKIRGYRIELGEIEARLTSHELVSEAAVIAREDVQGDKRLVAYVTLADRRASAPVEELRAWLGAALPEYMVPGAFVALEKLPTTPSGKLNRRALPAPDLSAYVSREYEEPQGEVESALADIWRDLLRISHIGRQDNFFELGGHSLHGMKLVVKIEERFGAPLSVITVFRAPTILQMACIIDEHISIRAASTDGDEMEFEEGTIPGCG